MPTSDDDNEDLARRADAGDRIACEALLTRYRARLQQMIALRMDRRLLVRVDPSDVVQEALADACEQLADYVSKRPIPFYPWLRQLACDRLIALYRRHIQAEKRSVRREERQSLALPDESVLDLADRLLDGGGTPSSHCRREEQRQQLRAALLQISEQDREVLVLRFLEKLSIHETAAVLGIREGTVKVRQLRALQRARAFLKEEPP